jgi:bifunctional non-homologous end joining protein LigD
MALAEYRRKRRFNKTPEPAGKPAKRRTRAPLRFVVQKHASRRLHYDFRLELDGVLVSWAVPKGPSLDPAEKRLAVHVEDHPLDYGNFEGRIPEGEYGAGEVIVWDRGTWIPDGDPHAGLAKGHVDFQLAGEKLTGGWRLLRMKGQDDRDRDNWLLVKRRDDAARNQSEFDVTEQLPASVKSGRRLESENGALQKPAVHKPVRQTRTARRTKSKALAPADFPLALATLVEKPPEGKEWLFEIKFDGYRLLVFVERAADRGARVRLITRNQLDWTARYSQIATAAKSLAAESAVLDGELVALDAQGVSRFQFLQNAAANRLQPLVFYAFDLLYLDGKDWRPRPLSERKERLAELIEPLANGPIRLSDHIAGRGAALLGECCRRGLEGIVCKRADRPYHAGRTLDWLKVKCLGHEELVIGGYTDSTAAGRPLGALLVGYFNQGDFVYAGRVGTGFDDKTLRDLHRRLKKLRQSDSPFVEVPARERGRGLHWVRPELVAQIEFGSWTDAGILRHASFQGLRDDKRATAVFPPESLHKRPASEAHMKPSKRRKESASRRATPRPAARGKKATVESGEVTSVVLTNPQRVLYPDLGLTKQNLADYYAAFADVLLPHVAGRPLSLLRCPEGLDEACFFQKHATAGMPQVLRRVPIEEKDGTEEYLVIDDADGLRALAQMSILEIHPWGSRAESVDQPDRLIFDLDPGPQVPWQAVVDAAVHVRDVLHHLDLESFVKTSGGKGLHVVAPLAGRIAWPDLKQFARALAEHLAQEAPERYTAKMAKAARTGRVFIDYLRNDRGSTAVAAFSPRAKGGAPISLPIEWEDLASLTSAAQFTIPAMVGLRAKQAAKRREAWRGFFQLKQKLPKFVTAR